MRANSVLLDVPVDQIRAAGNTRSFRMDDEHGRGLRDSVGSFGVLQPVLLTPLKASKGSAHRYRLVAGFRRYSAACEAGLTRIPAQVAELDDARVLLAQLTENSQRLDPNPLEEARAMRAYTELSGTSIKDLSRVLHKSASWVSGRLSLLELPIEIQGRLETGRLTAAQCAPLLEVLDGDPARIRQAADLAERGVPIQTIRAQVRADNFRAATGRSPRADGGICGPFCRCPCPCCAGRRGG